MRPQAASGGVGVVPHSKQVNGKVAKGNRHGWAHANGAPAGAPSPIAGQSGYHAYT